MTSKPLSFVSEQLIKKYDYELEIKQFEINELKDLCDKLNITIDEQDEKIKEQHKEIITLMRLLKIANPELLTIHTGQLRPYYSDEER
jgi:adenylate cyclase class IV